MTAPELPRLAWTPGTTITAGEEQSIRLSVPSLGRAWHLDVEGLARIARWIAAPAGPPPDAVVRLAQAGVLITTEMPAPTNGRWGPVRRFHHWADHATYRDGADPTGTAREAVIARFSPDDIARMRGADLTGASELVLADDLAELVWQASSRMRANRVRVAEADNASALLFSYGTAHDLIVIDPAAGRANVAWADLGRMGCGRPTAANPGAMLRAARLDPRARGVAVVGRFEDYQRRYRHEKAMRGFLVDGGRILGEVARAIATKYGSATVSDGPLPPNVAWLAGLDAGRFLVVGLAVIPDQG